MRWRLMALAGVVVAVSLAHYLTPVGDHDTHNYHPYHAFYRWFYHLPIILAGVWYGLRGGLGFAVAVTLLYLPHVLFQWAGGTAEQWLEIALYLIVGFVTGLVSDRQRKDRDRYRLTAETLDRAYSELKKKARILLEMEEQLRHADRLSVLGELSAGLAHEIKTPLASIRGAAEIVTADTTDEEERREFSQILVKEADRLNRVLSRFLEFARPREDAAPAADLADALDEVTSLVGVEARHRRVEASLEVPDDLPPVLVEPAQLRQVILNLVMNALQAMEDGGRLLLSAELAPGGVRLVVSDTGHGIPEEIRRTLFEPFVTSRPEGTGLGLSIVSRILENHGASIEVRPGTKGGTEVEVILPTEESGNE